MAAPSPEAENLGGELQERRQGARGELPREEEAEGRRLAVVEAPLTLEHAPEEPLGDVGVAKRRRMSAAAGPVNPGHAPVGQPLGHLDVQHGGEVVLVNVAVGAAELLELGVVGGVLDDGDGGSPVNFKPLGALPPLGEVDFRGHTGVVAAPPEGPVVVEAADEAVVGPQEVPVDQAEVDQRDAGLREEDEPLVGDVQEGVRQEPPLGVAHAHLPPHRLLQISIMGKPAPSQLKKITEKEKLVLDPPRSSKKVKKRFF